MFVMASLRLRLYLLLAFCLGRAVWGQNCSEFASPPQETAVLLGGMACLQCDYDPANANEFWERDGTAIRDNNINDICGDCELGTDRDFTTLCFPAVMMDDLADYVCVQQIRFNVQKRCTAGLVLAAAPEIDKSDTSAIEVAEEGSLVVTVQLTNPGNPPADVTFEKDGLPVNNVTDSRVSIDTSPTVVSLTIADARVDDRGEYGIVAMNSLGQMDTFSRMVNIKFISDIIVELGEQIGQVVPLTCRATVYPQSASPVHWERFGAAGTIPADENVFTMLPGPEVSVVSNLNADLSQCGTNGLRYSCVVRNGVVTSTKSVTLCTERPPPPAITVSVENATAFRVDWNNVLTATRYVIEYRPTTTNEAWISKAVDETGAPSYSILIGGVMTNVEYEFRAASGNNAGLGNYSSTQTNLIGLQSPITGVSATLTVVNGESAIKITWQESGDTNVDGYHVFIFPLNNVPFSVPVEGASNTEYILSNLTCGTSYEFIVQAYNEFTFTSGPNSSIVEHMGCVTPPGPPMIPIQIGDVTPFETSFIVSWTISPSQTQQTLEGLLIRLREIDQNTQEFKITFNYIINSSVFRTMQSTCVGDLRSRSRYEVCIFANFSGTMSEEMNCGTFTTSETDNAAVSSCLKPSSINDPRTGDESRSSVNAIPDWLIAVIVVVVLVIIALIFCFIGLCFACQTSKRKGVDFGSTSSIPTDIVKDRRSMSPPGRSCLSYHTSGHSTNWSDHVDTLRQLESGAATSV